MGCCCSWSRRSEERRRGGGERYEMSLRPTLPPACLFTPVIIVTVDISGGALSPPSVFAKSSSLVHHVRTNVAAIPLPLFDGKNEGGGSHASAPPRQRSRSRSDVMYQLQSSTCIGRCSHVNQRGLPTLLCVQPFLFFSPFLCSCRDSFRSEN